MNVSIKDEQGIEYVLVFGASASIQFEEGFHLSLSRKQLEQIIEKGLDVIRYMDNLEVNN